ncbi:hypothetical protein [Propionivibrio dicarboxylicus]|uniref:Uncharacterized protein n=1 Tax=Propionivibrio dicarboxylicus TaxID=83767 RepID=A0A1G8C7T5_9RHOO|nr:hypothetical protein [Propionivibrio dicarboxylicus]SDH41432.1 hypothetical protein SAMN05660652_01698 [Propionivibrio dicarboxylicus]
MLKRLLLVLLTAVLASLPASLFLAAGISAPAWYILLVGVAQAVGMGLPALAVGVVVLIARRDAEKGGIRAAIVAVVLVSIFTSQAALYPLLRG